MTSMLTTWLVNAMRRQKIHIIWAIWTSLLTFVFTRIATYNLEIFPPISGDESWIMSVAYKLATQGIFGSDLYAGLFNADQHYFIALPMHHFFQAISFQIAGAGVIQARMVSVLSGVAIIWAVSWLAYRWYGLGPALLAGVLLLCWSSHLGRTGLPLLDLARLGRYDLSAVAWMWIAICLLDWLIQQPRPSIAVALGICSGLAILTQFFGAFILPVVAGVWLWHRRREALLDPVSYWMIFGMSLILLPYLFYALRFSSDLIGQTNWFKADRTQFGSLAFYANNIYTEPTRYTRMLLMPYIGSRLFVALIVPVAILFRYRARRSAAPGDFIVWFSLVVFAGLLALFDSTKAQLYGFMFFPSLYMAVAVCGARALQWGWAKRKLPIALAVACLVVGLFGVVVAEGVSRIGEDRREAQQVSSYFDVGRKIDSYLRPGASILATDRWWWALHSHPYFSAHGFFSPWRVNTPYRDITFAIWTAQRQIDFVIVDRDMRAAIAVYPEALRNEVQGFLDTCTIRVSDWTDVVYGRIELYQIVRSTAPICTDRADRQPVYNTQQTVGRAARTD